MALKRIIDTDNFGGDYPNEKFIQIGKYPLCAPERVCEAIAKALNDWHGERASRYFKIVDDEYELAPGFEP